jgi:hypothetical protein
VVAEEEALAVANTMPMLETARACLRPVQRRWAPPSHRRPGRAVTDAGVVDRLRAGSGLVVPAASTAAREVGEHAACDLGQRDVDSGGDGGHDGKAQEAGAEREQRQRRGSLWMPSLDPCRRGRI